jgi:tetratricopeptide (TPR) repeat protein
MFRLRLPGAAVLVLLLVCSAAGPAPARAAGGEDDVALLDGSSLKNVTVLQAHHDEVRVDTDGDGQADRNVPAGSIVDITYGDEPLALKQGRFHLDSGNHNKARAEFREALEEKEARAFWLVPAARYAIAESLRRDPEGGREALERALAEYQTIIEDHPRSRRVPYAIRGIGRVKLAMGDAAEAQTQFEKLAGGRYGSIWTLRGKLGKARALSARDRAEQGLALAQQVIEAAREPGLFDVRSEAEDVRTELLFNAGRYEQVRKIYRQMAEAAPETNPGVKARAYNRIGDAYLAENKVKEAVFAYLRVRVLYPDKKEQLAHALYGAARCFTSMKKSREASELIYLLQQNHPDSIWTAKAKAELGD